MAPKAKKRVGAGGAGTASARPPVRAPAAKKKRPQANSETHDSRRQKVTHGVASAVGQVFMLFRLFVVGAGYRTCAGNVAGHVADSRVHRFERVVGFKRDEQDDIDADSEAARLHDLLRAGGVDSEKHQAHATNHAYLERYVLERHSSSEYAKW